MATILIKKRDTTGAPSAGDLTNSAGGAELAVNTADKRLYAKDSGGNVVELGTAPSTVDINAGSIDGTPIGAASASTGAFTTLSSNSTTTLNGTTIPASKTLLVSTDIGTSVQAYDADTAKYDDTTANFTGTLQNGGSNVVVDTDIGSTVQAYDADTAKYDDTTANFTGTLQNGGSNVLVDTDIGTNVQAYDADTAKYDDVTANFTGTLQNGGSNVVVDSDIGSTVQAYDADTAKYDDTTANFTGTLQNGGSNVLVDTDIGSSVLAYDSNLQGFVTAFTLPTTDGTVDQVLKTDGAGNIGFATVSGGGGTPGGSDTQIQYNSAGSFAGASGLVTDGSNLTLNAQGDLRFADSDSSNWVAFQAPATIASNITWTLPDADGSNGQVLSTNGSGTLSWASGGGGSSISAGDSSVAVTDAGTGKIEFTVDNVEVADFTTGAVVFNETGANQDFRVEGDTNANLLIADAGVDKVGIGTNTFNTNGGVLQVSNGISFPATQSACSDANTLDDYEEGTFTPTLEGNSTAGTTTYSTQNGSYTKIGRQVTVTLTVEVSAMTGTGALLIGNLPFTSASSVVTPLMVQFYNWSSGTYLQGFIFTGNSAAFVYALTDDGAWALQNVVNEAQDWILTATYFT